MEDFFSFRRMITPVIIQILFVIGALGSIVGGFVTLSREGNPVVGWALILVGPLVWRVLCENAIVFFRMNETLTDIRALLRNQARQSSSFPQQATVGNGSEPNTSVAPSGSAVRVAVHDGEARPSGGYIPSPELLSWVPRRSPLMEFEAENPQLTINARHEFENSAGSSNEAIQAFLTSLGDARFRCLIVQDHPAYVRDVAPLDSDPAARRAVTAAWIVIGEMNYRRGKDDIAQFRALHHPY